MQATIVFQAIWDAIHAVTASNERKYRYIILEGSSRSSKTHSLLQVFYLYAFKYAGKRLSVWRDTQTDCRDTVLADMQKAFPKMPNYHLLNYNATKSIFRTPGRSAIEIKGSDDEEKVMGYQGDVIWINEPYKISRQTFDQLDMRASDFVIIDWNPKMSHWVDDIKKDPRTITLHSTFKDNPFCPPEQRLKILGYQTVKLSEVVMSGILLEQQAREYDIISNPLLFNTRQINELSRCRENEHKNSANDFNWQVYGLGLKGEKPNRIFHWHEIPDSEYHAISAKEYTGNDWGKIHNWGILNAKFYDNCLYLHEVNYKSETELRAELSVNELAQIAQTEEGFVIFYFNRFKIPKDREIICDTNRPGKTLALRKMGYTRAIPAVNKSILDGLELLDEIKVYYTASSKNIAYEQENYSRKVGRDGVVLEEPEDLYNHLIDPARYIVLYLQRLGIIKNI